MEDIKSTDLFFTRIKSPLKPDISIMKKLDKILVNGSFMTDFPDAYGQFMPFMTLDHSTTILSFPKRLIKKRRAFRFTNYVVNKEEFLPTVEEVWNKEVTCHNMYKVVQKLKAIKHPMRKNGNLAEKVELCRGKLKASQEDMVKNPHDKDAKVKEAECLADYFAALEDEEKFMFQKAKVDWISSGDRNIKYLYKVITSKRNINIIMSVCNEKGERFEGNLVAHKFVQYFQRFLGTNEKGIAMNTKNLFTNRLTVEGTAKVVTDVTDKEIKEAMFDISENKAPGLNGFTFAFFKHYWSIIGKKVCQAIKEFFCSGKLLGEINATLITLISKIPQPNKVSDFRPIACCNVIYKCIIKILTNRIKGSLDKLVNISQSAFIPRRVTQDNLMITQELLKGYNYKNGAGRCALKIDIAKAYDTVD
ncbi:RNA-directed DNA polymerase, eukaryota, reverse transcriptase zinc-binding domain protein [Tanacetum coccineum]|uniref:RNA-directed DNA polymerase, eukaryota, reverse transcriptase zinc-binding domain protein n=1 Tax=Tanacetum coccineum TaxID=301880 RepID=A0ABQ5J422_9ASTR